LYIFIKRGGNGMNVSAINEKKGFRGALPAFRHRNFRLFWFGQLVSLVGTQMQMVALGWLVLRISNSPFYVGLTMSLGLLPILLFSLFAGMLADRVNKRRLLLATQTASLIQAAALTALVASGHAAVWNLIALAVVTGVINAVDSPTRQSFVSEMVPHDSIMSAVALNSMVFNGTRVVGPAVAGFMIHAVGESGCFFVNAASFVPVIAAIAMMRDSELFITGGGPARGTPAHELKEGFKYVRHDPSVRGLLAALAVMSLFAMPSMVLLPVFAQNVLHVGAKGMGWMSAATGAGAVMVMMLMSFAKRRGIFTGVISVSGLIFGATMIMFGLSRNFYLSLATLALAGAGLMAGIAMTNTTLQMITPQHLRGRVMGFYTFVFLGMAPPGSFLIGLAAEYFGAPASVAGAGVICFTVFIFIAIRLPRVLKGKTPEEQLAEN
jgi:MFS family permease